MQAHFHAQKHETLPSAGLRLMMWQVYGYLLAFQNRFALHISKVVVAKPHRRCGVARALIQVCCHPLEMLQICLTDFSWNVGALDVHLQSPHDIYDVVSLAGSVQLHKEGQCNLACRPSKHSSACALQFHRLRSGRHFRGLLLSWEACTQVGKAAGAVAITVGPDIELKSAPRYSSQSREEATSRQQHL